MVRAMVMLKKVIRTIYEHKGQYLGALILIFVSSTLFVMLNMVASNLDNTFNRFSQKNVLSDAEFYTNETIDINAIENQFNAKAEESGVSDCEIKKGQILRVFSENTKVNIPSVSEGASPKASEVLIDKLFSNANGYKVGDTLNIDGKNFKISGFVKLPNYIYIIKSKDEIINDPKAFGIGVVNKDDYKNLKDREDFYAIRFNNKDNLRSQETSVKNYIASNGISITNWISTEKNTKVSYIPMEIQTLSTMSVAVPLGILILTCILTGIIMWRLIKRESVIIGTFYAEGYRKRELIYHYLLFPIIIASVGSILGSIIGLILSIPVFNFMLTAFPMPVESIVYTPWFLLVAVLLPILVLASASYIVTNKILNIPPAELMKGSKTNDNTNFIEKRLNLDRFNFTLKFQIREQVRSISRTLFLLFGVIVATMLLLYGLTMKSSVDYLLNEGIKELYNMKFEYVFFNEKQGAPLAGTEQFQASYVTLKENEDISFYVTGVIPNTARINLKDLNGKKLTVDKVIMTVPLANKLNIKPGNSVLVFDSENGKEYTIKVDEIADNYAGEFVFMPLDQLNKMLGLPDDSYVGIWSDIQETFSEGEVKSTKSMDSVVTAFNSLIDQMSVMIYSLTVSAFVLGIIIIYIVTGLVIEENRNNISLMKVFGYKKKEINRLILNSNTIVVILGYLLGVPALLFSVNAFYKSLSESLQLIIPVKLNILYMIFGFIVVILTYEFAKLMCKRKVNSIPMSEAIKAGSE